MPMKLERAINSWPTLAAYSCSQNSVVLLHHILNIAHLDCGNSDLSKPDTNNISVSSVGCHFSDDLWS